jgi:hypothetical protein
MMIIAPETMGWMTNTLLWGIILNIVIMAKEILIPHDTPDTKKAIQLMTKGYYSNMFWTGIVIGNIFPFIMLIVLTGSMILVAGGLAIIGIFLTEFVRIRVPQMIPLS